MAARPSYMYRLDAAGLPQLTAGLLAAGLAEAELCQVRGRGAGSLFLRAYPFLIFELSHTTRTQKKKISIRMVAEAGPRQAWPAETTTNGVCCMDKTETTLKPETKTDDHAGRSWGQRDAGSRGGAA